MRRCAGLVVVLAALVGCGGDEGLPRLVVGAPSPATGVLRMADPDGITLLDTAAAEVRMRIDEGVRSRDWVFQSRITATGPQVVAVSPFGEVRWRRDLDQDVEVRLASSDGSRLALLPMRHETTDPYNPVGRSTTGLTVLHTDSGTTQTYRLDGNFEPEAFSTSGRSLFVIEYLPPMQPDRYRVRKLDLETGEIGAVYSVDGHLQESMRGTARVAALSADGSRLYTVYTTDVSSHGDAPQAFVHVLDLGEEWAHCVDLPPPIGQAPEQALAIAADPRGDRVLVVDAAAGVAELDANRLEVTDSVAWSEAAGDSGAAMAVVDRAGRLHAGRGNRLTTFDAELRASPPRFTPTRMLGLYVDPERDAVWVLGQRAMHAIDPETGDVDVTVALPDEMPVLSVPDAPASAPIQCAC